MGWWEQHFGDTTRGRVVTLLRRGQRSVEELAAALGLTDNAVRAQLTTLERDGVVHAAGVRREGMVGKPATLYEVAPGADTLFSSAYAPVLSALLAELGDRMPPDVLATLLRDVGRRLAPGTSRARTFGGRAQAAATLLADLGADADLTRTREGYTIVGHGCPLAQAVAACPETCQVVEQLLSEVAGVPVRECCDREGAPRCGFVIAAPARPR